MINFISENVVGVPREDHLRWERHFNDDRDSVKLNPYRPTESDTKISDAITFMSVPLFTETFIISDVDTHDRWTDIKTQSAITRNFFNTFSTNILCFHG